MKLGGVGASPFLLMFLGGVLFASIWSGAFIASKVSLNDIPPLWLAQIRLAAAGLIFFLISRATTIRFWKEATPRCRTEILVAGVLSQAGYLGPMYWALCSLPAGTVTVVVASLPLVAVPMGALILRERISGMDIVAALVGAFGVIIVAIGRDAAAVNYTNLVSAPVVITFLAVLALAAGNALIKRYVNLQTIGPVCALQMMASSFALLPFALYFHGWHPGSFSHHSIGAFLYLVLIGSVLGTYVWMKVLQFFTSKSANIFFLLTPIFGLGIGYLYLHEPLTWQTLGGAALVIAAIMFAVLNYRRRDHP
ncbi:MAG: DMT family transporter [Proteobacteria bacterium]|nr:DMT family transporter [Pseudomonadota bacterium]